MAILKVLNVPASYSYLVVYQISVMLHGFSKCDDKKQSRLQMTLVSTSLVFITLGVLDSCELLPSLRASWYPLRLCAPVSLDTVRYEANVRRLGVKRSNPSDAHVCRFLFFLIHLHVLLLFTVAMYHLLTQAATSPTIASNQKLFASID